MSNKFLDVYFLRQYGLMSIKTKKEIFKKLKKNRINCRTKGEKWTSLCMLLKVININYPSSLNCNKKIKDSHFKYKCAKNVIITIEDLIEFIWLHKTYDGRISNSVKRIVNIWLNKNLSEILCFNERRIKRVVAINRALNGFSLRDIIKVCHPKPKNDYMNGLFRYILGYKDWEKYGVYPRLSLSEKEFK